MYTLVGKIINSHGVNGSVKIYPYTDDVKRFSNLNYLFLGEEKLKLKIEKVFYQKNLVIVKFSEFGNINEILKFKEEFIYIKNEDRIELPENSYFISDLIGCLVVDTLNNELGVLTDVLTYSVHDIYVVKDLEGNNFYVPVVKEFVKNVDVTNRQITIDPIEGMLN